MPASDPERKFEASVYLALCARGRFFPSQLSAHLLAKENESGSIGAVMQRISGVRFPSINFNLLAEVPLLEKQERQSQN